MADDKKQPDEEKDKPAKSSEHNDESAKSDSSKAIPLEDEFEELPPEAKKLVRSFMFSSSRYMGPMPNPIASKINEKHIDKILESSDKQRTSPTRRPTTINSLQGLLF